jgi:lysozyme
MCNAPSQTRPVQTQPTRLSQEGLDHIKKSEQLRRKAYLPTPDDVWTIGWGHTKTARKGMVITVKEAEVLLRQDLAWVRQAIADLVRVPLTQSQYDALASFIFNLGRTNFAKSTMLRKLNKGDYLGAANEFPRWNKQKGKVLRGLTRRRAEERAMFLKGTEGWNA